MLKLAILLLLFGTTALLWQHAEAKPFLFLPPNFFVLTTRAPSTDSTSSLSSTAYSSSSTSSAFGGIFQLPMNIISHKLNFINSLLSSFNGGAGAGGNIGGGGKLAASGKFGGSFGVGFKFNAGTTTLRPRTTTEEANIVFSPQSTTNSPKATTGKTIDNSRDSTSTTTTENSLASSTTENLFVSSTIEALSSSTTKPNAEDLNSSMTENSTSSSKSIVDITAGVTSNGPTLVAEQPVFTETTEKITSNFVKSTESLVSSTVKSTITSTTEKYSTDIDSTSETVFSSTIGTVIEDKPTVVAQTPAIVTATEKVAEPVTFTTERIENNGSTDAYVDPTDKPEAEVTAASVYSGDKDNETGGYNYEKHEVSNGVSANGYGYQQPRPDLDNEIFPSKPSNMYLPVL
ncbi:PREDICTED: probable serine/threonine-protein kinase dyrk2 [Bactrocera latifrons]|uniref:probable serine/threonine-protein kinase dyrk2 n=1 Tax=Bactrocera latifrons TaxID=174628 RepID=UPI0008DE0C9B|nr:PREDICTED: probable serine/threonine-protein kinase dyrk2 [Bactrocera latifrons]